MKTQQIKIAKDYLGNLSEDASLIQTIATAKTQGHYLEVFLKQSDRQKDHNPSRINFWS